MLPCLSEAMLPIQREIPSLAASVPCWNTVAVAPERRSSYQRTLVVLVGLPLPVPPTATDWLTRRDCVPARLRYAIRYMRRSASESSLFDVPGCGMQVPPPEQA